MQYPVYRPRRTRRNETLRRMVRETRLSVDNLIYPLFVVHGEGIRKGIGSMPGVFQLSVDEIVKECRESWDLGIPAVILFGIPREKDEMASEASDPEGSVQKAVRAIKEAVPDMVVITDVCLCEYTSHGHCGVVQGNEVLNDPTLELLSRAALSHARAGADIVAPSDMMDGRVAAIRDRLAEEGFQDVVIMSYAVKYASAFYGPFREAAESTPQFGDRRAYQMDPPNAVEALRERFGGDLIIATDVCLCAYIDHGHCGVLRDGVILNDETLELLARAALSHARAGADIVAPSDMMDGRVGAIRQALDGSGYTET
ncbi:MAG: porphobilinogen synthase, partial [bacterium]